MAGERAVRLGAMLNRYRLRRALGFLAANEPYLVLPLVILPLLVPNPWRPAEAAIALAFMVLRRLVLGYWIRRTSLDLPIGLILIGALAGTAVSPLLEISIERLWGYVAVLLLFSLIVFHRTEANLRFYLALPAVAALIGSIWLVTWFLSIPQNGFVPQLDGGRWIVALVGNATSTIGRVPHQNGVASLLVVAMPFVLACSFRARSLARWVYLLSAVLLVAVVLVAGNDGGKLAMAAGAIGVIAVRMRWPWLAASVLVLPVATLVLGWLGPESGAWTQWFGDTAMFRLELWHGSFELLQMFPFTGVGLGVFPIVYRLLLGGEPSDGPHNVYLQAYFDLGPLGLIALLWFMISGLRASFSPAVADTWARSCIKTGLAGAWLAFAVSGSFEAIMAIVWPAGGTYHSILSPLPWMLGALGVALSDRTYAVE